MSPLIWSHHFRHKTVCK